jgi:hypothetical protein
MDGRTSQASKIKINSKEGTLFEVSSPTDVPLSLAVCGTILLAGSVSFLVLGPNSHALHDAMTQVAMTGGTEIPLILAQVSTLTL